MNAIMKQIGTGLLAIIVAVGITACSDDDYSSRLKELIIKDVEFGVAEGKNTQSFRSEDLTNYEASSDQDWCVATIDQSGLTVQVTANDTYEERIATVTVKDKKDEAMSRTFTVKQAQKNAVTVDQDAYEVPGEGGKVTITVKHNVDFSMTTDATWIKQAEASTRALESSDIVLEVEKNNWGGERSATVTLVNSVSKETTAVTIRQLFTPVFSVNKESLSIDERGGTLQVLVESNLTFSVDYSESWITKGELEKIDDTFYWQRMNVEAFTEKKASRTATVTFSNLIHGIYKEVQVQQTRALYIQAVTVAVTAGETYDLPLYNEGKTAVVWTSDNEGVATVNMDGKITGKAAGTATITVTSADGIYSDKVTVTVSPAPVIEEPEEEPEEITS